MKKLVLTVLMGVFAFTLSHAQGISGKWETTLEGPQGSIELTFTYKVDGTTLTGSVSSPMGGDEEIKNGKVNGNEFTYEVNMMDNTMKYSGKLEKDVIKLNMKFPEGMGGPGGGEGPGEMTLKKVE